MFFGAWFVGTAGAGVNIVLAGGPVRGAIALLFCWGMGAWMYKSDLDRTRAWVEKALTELGTALARAA